MNQLDRLILAREIVSKRSEESVNLNSYGNEKKGCVGMILCTCPEFNQLGLYNADTLGQPKRNYPVNANWADFAPAALGETFLDIDAFPKYCASYGRGIWDDDLLATNKDASHKTLALLRLDMGIKQLQESE